MVGRNESDRSIFSDWFTDRMQPNFVEILDFITGFSI